MSGLRDGLSPRCPEVLNGLPCVLEAGHRAPHRTDWSADPPTPIAPIWGAPLPPPAAPVQPVLPLGAAQDRPRAGVRGSGRRAILFALLALAISIVVVAVAGPWRQ